MQLQSDLPNTGLATQTAPIAYTRIPDAVLLDARLTPGQLRIYAVIARRADRDKATAFPSYKTIAKDAHVSRTSAIDGVKALILLGYLSKRAQESGQGDPTSNLYTISGEGSQIFVLPRPIAAPDTPKAAQKLDHRSADFAPQVVQPFDRGGANFGPEQESFNKKKENKIQENGRTRACTRGAASAPAAAYPELQKLLNDFQENIGILTGMAQEVICQLAEHYSADWVRDAIREAVIYEKRSLAYVRTILAAWRRNGRSSGENSSISLTSNATVGVYTASDKTVEEELVWPPPGLISDQSLQPYVNDPAVAAWEAISQELPQLGRFKQMVTPVNLIDNVLTVTVPDRRTYQALVVGLSFFLAYATSKVLGSGATCKVQRTGD